MATPDRRARFCELQRFFNRITSTHPVWVCDKPKLKISAQPGWKWATQNVCFVNEPRAPLYTHNKHKKQRINVRYAGPSGKIATSF